MPSVHRHIKDGARRRDRLKAVAGGSDPNRDTIRRIAAAAAAAAAAGPIRCMSVSAPARCAIRGPATCDPQRPICGYSGRYTYLWAGV